LLISCNTRHQYSSFKDDKIINPVTKDPDFYFDYLLTGEIFPKSNIDAKSKEKAIFSIEIFQLNNQPTLSTLYINFPDFKSFVKNIYSKIFQQPKQQRH